MNQKQAFLPASGADNIPEFHPGSFAHANPV